MISLARIPLKANVRPKDLALLWEERTGLARISGEEINLYSGTNGYISYYGAVAGNGIEMRVKALFFVIRKEGFILLGSSPKRSFRNSLSYFDSAVATFRPLTDYEADAILIKRIRIYITKGRDSFAKVTGELLDDASRAKEIAEFNGMGVSDPLPEGTVLKVPSF